MSVPPLLNTAFLSDVGRVRKVNQDEVSEFVNGNGARLVVVADGMGGHAGGEVASSTSVQTIGEYFASAMEEPTLLLRHAFEAANDRVYRMGNDQPDLHGMGTTAVAVLLETDGTAWVAHVGDSRAYRLHQGQLERLTDDHSWVQEQVRLERITPEEAETHPRRNALLRSIGVDAEVEVDVSSVEVQTGDRLLLCSDGLWGEVDDQSIAGVLASEDPQEGVRLLVQMANDAGGHDNVTVAVVAMPGGAETLPLLVRTPGPAGPGAAAVEVPARRGVRMALAAAVGVLAAIGAWLAFGGGG
jgi:serine/threonine protein phosphatase PrpC